MNRQALNGLLAEKEAQQQRLTGLLQELNATPDAPAMCRQLLQALQLVGEMQNTHLLALGELGR